MLLPERDYVPYMKYAITLAQKGRWQTVPNPNVGAVLVRNDVIVAEGWHQGAGKPHAEMEAITYAKDHDIPLAECILVVTLEPCCHQGKTPPCTTAIIESGIKHVIIGAKDPNPQACGGIAILHAAGITVNVGIAERQCLDLIDDFVVWQTTDLPYTILKLASTLDGRIATRTGHSKWVTAPKTRDSVHDLRQHMGAILIGGNTFYHDDPKLTARNPFTGEPFAQQPLRVVATSRLPEITSLYQLISKNPETTIFWTTVASAASPKAELLRKHGIRVLGLPSAPRDADQNSAMRSTLDFTSGLINLRKEMGCHYVLCEGGGKLGLSLLYKGFMHELHLHLAPKILGDNEATPLFDGLSPNLMSEAVDLRITNVTYCERDIVMTLKPGIPSCSEEE